MPEIPLHSYTAEIKEMIRNDHHDEAIAHCRHVLRLYPKHLETYCLLGEACLEKEMYREAIECFQRTLGADPENLISRVGLGIILGEQGMLPEAIWQMERAFELAPGNSEVRRELQRLYTQRDSVEKARLKLTPGALGRLYARNGLYERAITEFRSLLHQDPNLPDTRVALAEALWRDGRRLEAVDVCLDLLSMLPNCLKANLILGEVWKRGGNEDAGEEKLNLARALDPENLVAQVMMGKDSPLPPQEVLIPRLEVVPTQPWIVPPAAGQEEEHGVEEEEFVSATPDRVLEPGREEQMPGLPGEEAKAGLVAVEEAATGGGAEEEPEWLRELGLTAAGAVVVSEAAASVKEEEAMPAGEIPEWLRELGATEGAPVAAAEIATLDEVVLPEEVASEAELAPAEEVPDWLRALGAAGGVLVAAAEIATPGEEVPPEAELAPAEQVPDWLRELGAAEGAPVAAAEIATLGEGVLSEEVVSEAELAPADEVPDWLQELGIAKGEEAVVAPEAEAAVAEVLVLEEAEPVGQVPESLQALVEAGMLDEADLAAAMAQMTPEELASQRAEAVPDWLKDLLGEEAVTAVDEAAAPEVEIPVVELPPLEVAVEEIPDWLKALGVVEVEKVVAAEVEIPEAELPPLEAAEPVEEVVAAEEIPDWLKVLGIAEAEKVVAAEVEIPKAELPPLKAEPPVPEALVVEVLVLEEAEPVGQVPESLKALVEAGMLDEADVAAAMAQMTPEELASQHAEAVPDWLKALLGEEAATSVEVAVTPPEVEVPVVELPPPEATEPVEEEWPVEEIPDWLKALGVAEVEKVVAAEVEIQEAELPPLKAELSAAEAAVAEVPESLQALAEAGILDEAEVAAAMAQMTPEELASQRAEAVPDWLKDLLGDEAVTAVEVAAAPPEAEIPVMEQPSLEVPAPLEEVVAVEEIPDWLKALGLAEVEKVVGPEAEIPVVELPPPQVPVPAAEVPSGEEIPEWLRELGVTSAGEPLPLPDVAEEEMVELSVEEPVPGAVAEGAPEFARAVEEAVPVLELPLVELAPPPVEELVPSAVAEAAPEAVLAVEQVAPELVKEQAVPLAEEVVPPSRLDDLLGQLKARPRDYQLQLEVARLYAGQHDWSSAFKYYEKLVASRRLVPAVIEDLQQPLAGTEVDPARLYQLLGDAYMHEDRLDEALDMYRLARQALKR